jgi:predicted transcriptional regulator
MARLDNDIEADDLHDFIKEYLERGEIKEIAEESGLTADAAYKILGKRTKNHGFVRKCYERAMQRAREILAMKEQTSILRQKIESI